MPYFRRNLGVVFQDFRLLPNKTVFDNVAFALQVIGKSKGFIQEAVPDVLKMVGLAGKQGRFPHELSGGEQQRVAMARAVVNKPAILLADEPTGNLDPNTSAGIMQLLSRDQRQRHHGDHGHPRRRHRRPDAAPRDRADQRPDRARRARRRIPDPGRAGAAQAAEPCADREHAGGRRRCREPDRRRRVRAAADRVRRRSSASAPSRSRARRALLPAAPEPDADQPHTGTITVVEPAVTNVRETPERDAAAACTAPAPAAERAGAAKPEDSEPTPLVPPPLNEPDGDEALMRLGLILSEVGQGFRRNLSMVVSVVLVTFISLTFFGAAILLQSQITQTKGYWYDRAQVAIYLCTDISSEANCSETAATEAQKADVAGRARGRHPRARTSRRSSSRITTRRTRTSSTSSRARPPRSW